MTKGVGAGYVEKPFGKYFLCTKVANMLYVLQCAMMKAG